MTTRHLSALALSLAVAASAASAARAAQATPPAATVPSPEPSPVSPAVPSVAPGFKAPDVRPTAADVVGVTQQPFVGIALPDAIGMALMKNPDLAVAAANAKIASYQIRAARGAYDVRFMIEPSIKHAKSAPENAFFAGPNFGPVEQNIQNLKAGVSGQLPLGTQYSVSLAQTRVDDNTVVNAFDPYYLASLDLSVTQPLLKNAGINQSKLQLELARIGDSASRAGALAAASTTIANVENVYWDLVAAWRNAAIQEAALRNTIAQQNSNVRLAKKGAAAPIDAVESSTQVAVYQDNVFSALQTVSELQNQLKSLIVDDPADPIWRANLMPTSPVQQLPAAPHLSDELTLAMQHRPELAQAQAAQAQANADLAFAKNQMLPQVDLQLQYQGNGFAGNALPPLAAFGAQVPPGYLGGTYGNAYGNLGRFPTYSAGVVISTPIGNNTARADLAVAHEQQRIAKIQSNGVDERIVFDVRNAVQGYQSALARLYAARRARENAQAVYASEERKFKNGASTTFLVLQRETELVADEGRELQAQTDLNKAIVEMQRADGTILQANNVALDTLGKGDLQK
ncbi:MAG: TolC family protein [bacterium]|nr:TolC family protein [bacterium]